MFKISGFADEIDADLDVQLKEFSRLNIQYIEVRGINGKNIADIKPCDMKIIKNKMENAGVKISAIGSPIGKITLNDDFNKELDRLKNCIELATMTNTKYIRMFSFYTEKNNRNEVIDRLGTFIDVAADADIVLLHENEKEIYGDTDIYCLDLLKTLNSPYFRATFDPANFVQCKVYVKNAFELLSDYIEYFHIKDAVLKTGEVVPSGMGDGNLPWLLATLKERNWNGFLSLEPHLADFKGFSSLEKKNNALAASDSVQKFTLAYNALMNIIN